MRLTAAELWRNGWQIATGPVTAPLAMRLSGMTRSHAARSRTGSATRLFTVAAVCWFVGAAMALAWILSYVVGDRSPEVADEAVLALVVTSPLYLVALAGVLIVALSWDADHVSWPALAWSVIALGVGLAASLAPLTVGWTALTTGGVELTPGAAWIATYPQGGATYYLYPQDLLPLWFVGWGLVALVAAARGRPT